MCALHRIEEKLEASKKSLNFYEAQQLYTTLYYRYNTKGLHEKAREFMVDGAKFLFENKQDGSAVHLSLLYVESLEKNVQEITNDIIKTLAWLHSLMPGDMPEVESFDKRSVMWSSKCKNAPKTGDKQLRKQFALTYWKNKMYFEARQNFLYADDGAKFGEMLQELSVNHGFPGEIDLFLAQAVLQLLCLQSYKVAVDVFSAYTEHHPQVGKGPPFKYPLINFLCFLLVAVEKRQLTVFTILCDQYSISLQRDILYSDYLQKIAERYFGISTGKKKPAGMLQSLMHSMFEANDDEASLEGGQDIKPKVNRTMTEEDLD